MDPASSTEPWFRPIEEVTGRPTRTRLSGDGEEIVVEISGRGLGWIEIKRCEYRGKGHDTVIKNDTIRSVVSGIAHRYGYVSGSVPAGV